ncbi:S9 family peptidase [Solicola gregarius]|uniref:Prolyl oligopeptidase family serine peptidase n=1 Tax=Solicola gregarius TaxID=2908642 RepID=A0AA46YK54_9ACTN|nr:prolyl oligopeptidase family serine peptidase [Solicola gregarius]UYM04244.1 prolyl oligopeptidase family serine peptidase [Solicola gregarius]
MSRDWRSWFAGPQLATVRPAAGDAGLSLVVEEGSDGSYGRIWDAASEVPGEPLPFAVGLGAVLSPDGRWVVDLDDNGGSEVGFLQAMPVGSGEPVRLAPERAAYVLRGLEFSADATRLAATVVDDDGYHLLVIPAAPWGSARTLFSSPNEAWYGHLSADGSLACIDTTDHCPGVRRPAVTVLETRDGREVAVLDDLPAGPIRAVRFSGRSGDPRVLISTERSGFARPAIWNPLTGDRVDIDLPALSGEVMALDWHADSGSILAVHVDDGVQRLLLLADDGSAVSVLGDGDGSYVNPDVANVYPTYSGSYFTPDGEVRVVGSRWDLPLHVRTHRAGRGAQVLLPPAAVPAGRRLTSSMIESEDGTRIQLWWARPDAEPRGTVLEVHGGPNLVAVDGFNPSAQAWLDAGFAYASLNYRGSVCFGRTFREGFWAVGGDREIEDIESAVCWLRGQGLATPDSTFITGASYGGHLTLLSIARLPTMFAGGLAHVAMADWRTAYDDMNPALRSAWTGFLGGAPDEVPDILARYSAINLVDRVTASAWLYQGARDTRTPAAQAQRYADALRASGGDVVIDWFDAGHEPTGLGALEHGQARMLHFVERTLAGLRWDAATQETPTG